MNFLGLYILPKEGFFPPVKHFPGSTRDAIFYGHYGKVTGLQDAPSLSR
jgi:hypothetical protein